LPVVIRLSRVGRNKICRYRMVVTDSRAKRDGASIETIGTYNPQAQPKAFTYKADRVAHWIGMGAQPSVTVMNLLKQDRFAEKKAATAKGLDPATANIARKAERTRKKNRNKAAKAD
jgi:small subunit ribosomal protein S16